MNSIGYVVIETLHLVLYAANMLLFLRAILSWFMREGDNKVMVFLVNVTEPILWPMRKLLSNWSFARSCPIDLSYLATFLALDALMMII